MGYKEKTISALSWGLGAKIFSQVLSFVIGIVIARLLLPSDFGLIAMVMIFVGIASLFSDVGFGASLIQARDLKDSDYSSVFWLNLALGAIASFLLYGLASPIALFYGSEELEGIFKLLAICFFIGALAMVPQARLAKDLNFKGIAFAEMMAMFISGLVAIYMASNGYGYWSLVAQQFISRSILTVAVWLYSRWLPDFVFELDSIKRLFGFSRNVFLTQLLQYLAKNLDKFLIGKYLSVHGVGVYDKAYSMMLFPLTSISHSLGAVMFPSFSQIQDDKIRVKRVFLRSVSAIGLLTFPMMAGIFAVADTFILTILGDNWVEVIPVLKILCIAGACSSIVTIIGSVYLSQGASALQLKVNLITKPIMIILLIIGLQWGLHGVAWGYVTATLVNSIITLSVAGKLIDLRLTEIAQSLYASLFSSILMACVIIQLSSSFDELPLVLKLLMQVATGVLSYICILYFSRNAAFFEILSLISSRAKRRRNT